MEGTDYQAEHHGSIILDVIKNVHFPDHFLPLLL